MILACQSCGKIRKRPPSLFKKLKRNLCRACHFKTQTGEGHHSWAGNNVSYKALHDWVNRNFGKPKICHRCFTTVAKKYEWANISKKYKRDRDDWIRLCTSCHHQFDNIHKRKS